MLKNKQLIKRYKFNLTHASFPPPSHFSEMILWSNNVSEIRENSESGLTYPRFRTFLKVKNVAWLYVNKLHGRHYNQKLSVIYVYNIDSDWIFMYP